MTLAKSNIDSYYKRWSLIECMCWCFWPGYVRRRFGLCKSSQLHDEFQDLYREFQKSILLVAELPNEKIASESKEIKTSESFKLRRLVQVDGIKIMLEGIKCTVSAFYRCEGTG